MSFLDLKFSKAKKLIKKGNLVEAKILFEEVLIKFPDNIRAKEAITSLIKNSKNSSDHPPPLQPKIIISGKKQGLYERKIKSLNDQLVLKGDNIKKTIQNSSDIDEVEYLFKKKMIAEALLKADLIYEKYKFNEKLNIILGDIFDAKLDFIKAITYYKDALKINSKSSEAFGNMGVTFSKMGEHEKAIEYYKKALFLNPNHNNALANLGNTYTALSRFNEAIDCYQRALVLSPNNADILLNMAHTFGLMFNISEAHDCFLRSIKINPNSSIAHNNHGVLYLELGEYENAIKSLKTAIALDENNLEPLINYASLLGQIWRESESTEIFQKIITIDPNRYEAISNFLLLTNYSSKFSKESSSKLHKINGALIEEKFKNFKLSNQTEKNKKHKDQKIIKIGFVSADLREHSVTYFLEPLLKNINKNLFSITCYNNSFIFDNISQRIKDLSDNWYDVEPLTNEKLFSLVQSNEIDILIDLSGHTRGNRMPLFAMKPAKIQISWLGYPNTTGIKSIDYRIVDNFTDPENLNDHLYTEKLLRINGSFICFSSDEFVNIDKDNLSKTNDFINFGSFNNLSKMTDEVIECWSNILIKQKKSKLILKNKQFNSPYIRDIVLTKFNNYGVSEDQMIFLSWSESRKKHLQLYNSIDLALDTFPYNGTTTTFEAMWMNVPVLCLEGEHHSGRVGYSILKNLNLEEMIVNSKEKYIEKALYLANNRNELNQIGMNLRSHLMNSKLCDAKLFAEKFENILYNISEY